MTRSILRQAAIVLPAQVAAMFIWPEIAVPELWRVLKCGLTVRWRVPSWQYAGHVVEWVFSDAVAWRLYVANVRAQEE